MALRTSGDSGRMSNVGGVEESSSEELIMQSALGLVPPCVRQRLVVLELLLQGFDATTARSEIYCFIAHRVLLRIAKPIDFANRAQRFGIFARLVEPRTRRPL